VCDHVLLPDGQRLFACLPKWPLKDRDQGKMIFNDVGSSRSANTIHVNSKHDASKCTTTRNALSHIFHQHSDVFRFYEDHRQAGLQHTSIHTAQMNH
jgi:hypothetical protein